MVWIDEELDNMENFLIAAVLIVVLFFAVRSAVGHFRGEGSCCGGGSYKAKSKRLTAVIAKKTFRVEGMHGQNCQNRVMEAIQAIPGLSARVELKKGLVTISYAKPVADQVIREAIEKAGYQVIS